MLETKTGTNIKIKASPKNSVKQISDDGIKNFLHAVCDIVAYDLEHKKTFEL